MKCIFVTIINSFDILLPPVFIVSHLSLHLLLTLPPEAFQRRYNIFKKSFYFVICLITHFQCISNCIQNAYCLLIISSLYIRISLSTNCNIIHRRDFYNFRFTLRHIKFLVLFFKIKCHLFSSFLLSKFQLLVLSSKFHLHISFSYIRC